MFPQAVLATPKRGGTKNKAIPEFTNENIELWKQKQYSCWKRVSSRKQNPRKVKTGPFARTKRAELCARRDEFSRAVASLQVAESEHRSPQRQ